MNEAFNGIEGNHMTGVRCGQIVRFSHDLPTLRWQYLSPARCPKRSEPYAPFVFDDTADRDWLRTDELPW